MGPHFKVYKLLINRDDQDHLRPTRVGPVGMIERNRPTVTIITVFMRESSFFLFYFKGTSVQMQLTKIISGF